MASAFLQDEGGLGASVIHANSASASITVPDAHLLFSAHFSRSGPDLVLTGADGRHYIVPGYFSSEHPPALAAPNGAQLSADVIGLMAGSSTPGEYAQAQPTTPPDLIGKVEKLVGDATVIRNGVAVTLNIGDAVYQSDVVQTGPDSKVGIGFPDGTALELLANTRMALSEYSYDPNGHANSALFSYVEGTFGFFAGKVAHTGDMKIATPVATMGIRGTTGVMGQGTDANGHDFYWQSIYDDPHTNISGSWDDFGQNSDGTSFVEITVSQPGEMTVFTLQGPGLPPLITTIPIPESYNLIGLQIIEDLWDIIQLLNVTPHSLGVPGSPENPQEILPPDNLPGFGNGPQPIFYIPLLPPGGGPPLIIPIVGPPTPSPGTQTGFIWPSGDGTWDTAFGWLGDEVPISSIDTVTIESGIVQYGSSGGDNYVINSLIIDSPGQLDIASGLLNIQNGLDDGGILLVEDPPSFSPTLTVSGPVAIEAGAKLIARGIDTLVDLTVATVKNSGTVAARHGGDVEFIADTVTNAAAGADSAPGKIKSVGFGSVVDFTDVNFDNGGVVLAKDFGGIFFVDASVTNEAGGKFTARDGGSITFSTTPVDNSGDIRALFGGFIKFEDLVTNEAGGDIRSAGCESCVVFTGNELDNFGTVAAARGGDIKFFDATINNEAAGAVVPGGTIEARDWGSVGVYGGTVTNGAGALVEADRHGTIEIKDAYVLNGGTFRATDCGLICIQGCDASVTNTGEFVARDFGTIVFDRLSGVTNEDGGKIEARDGGRVVFVGVSVTNYDQSAGGPFHHAGGGVIAAIGCCSQVDLADATIAGGRIETRDGGAIETIYGCNTFLNVTLDGAFVKVDCGTSLALDGGASGLAAKIDGCVVLAGGGVVTMAYESYRIEAGHDGGTLVNDTTLSGLGQIGRGDGALLFVNDGVLKAHLVGPDHGNAFIIDTGFGDGGAATTFNSGLMEACGPCVALLIENTVVDNDCGTIAAFGPGAAVDLVNSVIAGGTLATADPCDPCFGIIQILSPGCEDTNTVVFDGTGQKVTVDAFVQVQEGATLELLGTIDNKGVIDVDPESGPGADLAIDGTVELRGPGVVTLDGPNDQITGVAGTDAVLENFSTIEGEGSIGSGDNALKLVNEAKGTIEATGGFCDPLIIDTGDNNIVNDGLMQAAWFGVLDIESKLDNSGDVVAAHYGQVTIDANVHNEDGGKILARHGGIVTLDDIKITNDDGAIIKAAGDCSIVCIDCSTANNAGTIEAKHGGSVFITYTTVHNAGGLIDATGFGSTVDLAGATIDHGTLETSHHGVIETVSGNSTFDAVTIADGSEVLVNDATSLTLDGTIHNHGTIDVDGSAGADLIVDGAVTLDGNGTVTLDGTHDTIVGDSSGSTLDNVNDTIDGFGKIGGDQLAFDNGQNGTVDADVAGRTLVLDTGSNTVRNAGDLESTNGGILKIKSSVDNGGGTIGAFGVGSLTELIGVTIKGGTLETGDPYWLDDGVIAIAAAGGAMSVFDGLSHAVKIEGFVQVDPGAQLEFQGNIDNNGGTVDVDQSNSRGSDIVIDGTVTLSGDGALALEGNSTGIVAASEGGTLDNESYIYGSRGGQIGTGDDSLTFNNSGTVNSEAGEAGPLVINTGDNVIANTGTLEATGGSELDLHGTIDNAGGTVAALFEGITSSPTVVKLFGATIEGGTLTTDSLTSGANSMIEVTAGAASTFDGSTEGKLTVNGYVQVDDGANLALAGTIDNLGTIDVDGASGAELTIDDTVKLKGDGDVILDDHKDQIVSGTDSATLDNFSNISGQGTIGDDSLTLINENSGVIDADGAKPLFLNTGDNAIENKGTLEATNGATLDVQSDVDNASGLIEADSAGSGSTLKFEAVTVSHGEILVATGNTLEIENGETIFSHVDVENSGHLKVDDGDVTATLLVDNGTTLSGIVDVGSTGELDVNGASLGGATINDKGDVNFDGPVMLTGDLTVNLESGGTFEDSGTITVAAGDSATLAGVNVGMIDIASNATLTLQNADADVIDFVGSDGTLKLDTPANVPGLIEGLTVGDTIDLAGITVTDAVINGAGTELTVTKANGHTLTYDIAGESPSQDYFAIDVVSNNGNPVSELTLTLAPPPTFASGATANVNEGVTAGTVVYTAAATDTLGLPITYSLTGQDAGDFSIGATTGIVTIDAVPDAATKNTYDFGVVASDAPGASATQDVTLTINDLPITAAGLTGTVTVQEGNAVSGEVATFTDGDSAAVVGDFTATINWGDSTGPQSGTIIAANGGFTVDGTHTYAEARDYTATITINDAGGSNSVVTDGVDVTDAPLTAGSVMAAGGVEGVTPTALTATFTDANPLATAGDFSGTINWGDGNITPFTSSAVSESNGIFTVSGSHQFAEAGTYDPKVTINDAGGSTTTDTGTTSVADAPLTAGILTASGGVEGDTAAALTAAFTDANPSATTGDFSGTINWGDGNTTPFTSGAVSESNGIFTVSGSHQYAEAGTYDPTVTINDAGGSTTTDTGTTTVADAPLTAAGFQYGDIVDGASTGTIAVARFTDGNSSSAAGDFTATINWGDGTTATTGTVIGQHGQFEVEGAHTYEVPYGTYTITVSINDDDGGTATATDIAFVNPPVPIDNDQATLGLTQLVVTEGVFPSGGSNPEGIPLGAIRTFAGSGPVVGTDAANGGLLSIEQYTALFSILGTAYGGDGRVTFGLPNLADTLAVGPNNNPNTHPGQAFGSDNVALTALNLPYSDGGQNQPFDNDQPSLTVNYLINIDGSYESGGTNLLGEIVPILGNVVPQGYALAEGQLLQISQNGPLFALFGTTYGGNGTTTFALPNLTGETIVGAGEDFQGNIANLGQTFGQDTTMLTPQDIPPGFGQVNNQQPSLALNYIIDVDAPGSVVASSLSSPAAADAPYIGEVMAYAGTANTIPTGWMLAEGQSLPISEFELLYTVIGSTYGGNNTTFFNLPDLVDRAVAGLGGFNPNLDGPVMLGDSYGSNGLTLTTSEVGSLAPPPSVAAGATAVYDPVTATPVILDSTIATTDPDVRGLVGATVKIAAGFLAGDQLTADTSGTAISAGYDAATGVLTLSGTDTLAHYTTVLDSVTYSSTAADPTDGLTDLSRTISWQITDPDNGVSNNATSTVNFVVPPAEPFAWATDASGGWAEPTSWNNDGFYPGQYSHADQVVIAPTGSIVVTYDTTETIDSLTTNSNATLDLTGGALTITSTTAQLLGPVENAATLQLTNGTVDLVINSGNFDVIGDNTVLLTGDVDNSGGTIAAYDGGNVSAGSTIMLGDGVTITNGALDIGGGGAGDTNDTLLVTSGDAAALTGVTVTNDGAINVNGGSLTVDATSTIGGSGSVDIGAGGTVDFQNAFDQNVTFTGDGLLALGQPSSFDSSHSISGFAYGDAIDLTGFAYSQDPATESFTWTQGAGSGTLTVTDGALSTSLTLDGTYGNNFTLEQDASGGTDVVYSQPGFSYSSWDYPAAVNQVPSTYTVDVGINNAGQIIGDYYDSQNVSHAFLSTGVDFTLLSDPDVPGSSYYYASAINNSGQVAGDFWTGSVYDSFIYNSNDGSYDTLTGPVGTDGTIAYGISDTGQVVGYSYVAVPGASNSWSDQGFIYSGGANGTYTTLNDSNAGAGSNQGTVPIAINNSGEVVGYYYDSNGAYHGFLYSNGGFTELDYPEADAQTAPYAINNAGEVVGYFNNGSNVEGFIYSGGANGTWTALNVPGASNTYAYGINNEGQVLGDYSDANGEHAFIYSNGIYTTLDFPNGLPAGTDAYAFNDAGEVVGSYSEQISLGEFVSFGTFGFVAEPSATIPIPTGATLTLTTASLDYVRFEGSTGTLDLDQSLAFSGAIGGFAGGDLLNLDDLSYSPHDYAIWTQETTGNDAWGALAIHQGDTLEETLYLYGTYAPLDFALSNNAGAVQVSLAAAGTVDEWTNASGGSWETGSNWSGGVPGPTTNAYLDDAVTVTLSSDATVNILATALGAVLTIDDGAALTVTTAIDNAGTIGFDSTGGTISGGNVVDNYLIDVIAPGTIDANVAGGQITIESGATLTVNGTLNLQNLDDEGTLVANGGLLTVASSTNIFGAGSVLIENGGTADFLGAFDQNVTFGSGGGTLELAQPASFDAGHVIAAASGSFASDDIFDLIGFATTDHASVGSFDSSADTTTLTIYDSSNDVLQTFTLAADQSGTTWTVAADASHTGIDVYDPPAAAAETTATIAGGGSLSFDAPSSETVTFTGGTGSLVLDDPSSFTGHIDGFTGTAPDAQHSDVIDLAGINYNSTQFAESYNSATGVLTVTDGVHGASLTFDNFNGSFKFAADGSGGTDIFDPPAADSANSLVSIGSGNDQFVFHPGMGAETVANFNPQQETIELDHFAHAQSVQELQSLITTDPHGNAVIDLGHHDSITLPGMTAAELHAVLQTAAHLH